MQTLIVGDTGCLAPVLSRPTLPSMGGPCAATAGAPGQLLPTEESLSEGRLTEGRIVKDSNGAAVRYVMRRFASEPSPAARPR